MITSEFILNILHLALTDDNTLASLQQQIPFLTIKEVKHTGIGLFIYLDLYNAAQVERHITTIKSTPITGVEIRSDKEKVLADAVVHVSNGLIDYIEIFNKNGEDYPVTELACYEMYQTWLNENQRKYIVKSHKV